MSRVGMVIGLTIFFIGWILYRLLIKKDLKKNLNNLYLELFFIGIWILFYFFVMKLFKNISIGYQLIYCYYDHDQLTPC